MLLWCGNVNAAEPVVIHKDADSITFKHKRLGVFKRNKYAAKHCAQHQKFAHLFYGDKNNGEVIYHCSAEILSISPTSGRGRSWSNTQDRKSEVYKIITKEKADKEKERAKKRKKVAELLMIEEYKKTCSALGFELGTDKFADCTLKLYVADNKETTQIVQSSSGAQEMIIYDPDRERRIQQKAWNDLLHGRCQLSVLSKNPC